MICTVPVSVNTSCSVYHWFCLVFVCVFPTGCTVARSETSTAQLNFNGRHQYVSCCDLLVPSLVQIKLQDSCSITVLHVCCSMDYTSPTRWTEARIVDCTIWTYTSTAKMAIPSCNNSCSFGCTDLYVNFCCKNWWWQKLTVSRCVIIADLY